MLENHIEKTIGAVGSVRAKTKSSEMDLLEEVMNFSKSNLVREVQ